MKGCTLKGFLSFIVLWMLGKEKLTGKEISEKIMEMKGCMPSPGTIYPALKELERQGYIGHQKKGKEKRYGLTAEGKNELRKKEKIVKRIFGPICK